jgi:hypothetical protein
MNVERTEYCLVKCFYFAVTYSVAVNSDSVGPSFKEGTVSCTESVCDSLFFKQVQRQCLKMNYGKNCA